MDRTTSLLLGVLVYGLIGATALFSCAPRIEEDLATRSAELSADAPWLAVDVEGQVLRVSGTAPDEIVKANVLGRLENMWGVRAVEDDVYVASAPSVPAVSESEPVAPEIAGSVVADTAFEQASQETSADTTDEASEEVIQAVAEQAVDEVPTEESVAEAVPEGDVGEAALLSCQKELDRLVEGQRINFAFGSVSLAESSHDLLIDIADVAGRCDVAIEVSGHTDSTGHPLHNQSLSRQRAQSVVRFLVDKGVSEGQLSAFGFGAERPIADNATRSGRRANRRIEFKAVHAGSEQARKEPDA